MARSYFPDTVQKPVEPRLAQTVLELNAKRTAENRKLITRMTIFYKEVVAADFAQMGPHGGKTEYKGTPGIQSSTKKPYRLPAMYQGVEELVDFKIAMAAKDYESAKVSYFIIKRMLGR